jgi:hypothetical protein
MDSLSDQNEIPIKFGSILGIMPLTASTAAAAAVEAAEAGAAVAAAVSSGGGSQSLPNTPQSSEMPNLTPGKIMSL